MPYKYDDAWHRQQRAFIKRKKQSGRVQSRAIDHYPRWLHQAWELLGEKDPLSVTLDDMYRLEGTWPIGENTKSSRLSVVRAFLTDCGNKDAMRWEIRARAHPKEDRVYLSEEAVADIREAAHQLGWEMELIYSLGVDNSLRAGDQSRIRLEEAKQLLWQGQAIITCKGANGGKRRLLVMSKATREPLKQYLKCRAELVAKHGHDPGNLLLVEHNGLKNMSAYGVAYRIRQLSKAVGLRFRSHDLRATFGNRHWKAGTDILLIAAMMGHENPNTTFRCYIGVNQGDQRVAQDRLSGGL